MLLLQGDCEAQKLWVTELLQRANYYTEMASRVASESNLSDLLAANCYKDAYRLEKKNGKLAREIYIREYLNGKMEMPAHIMRFIAQTYFDEGASNSAEYLMWWKMAADKVSSICLFTIVFVFTLVQLYLFLRLYSCICFYAYLYLPFYTCICLFTLTCICLVQGDEHAKKIMEHFK